MTVPLSLTGKYQLVVLGQEGNAEVNACAARLVDAVSRAFHLLGVNPGKFLMRSTPGNPGTARDRRMLTAGVYFGCVASPSVSAADATVLGHLLEDGALIIPVVESITHFTRFIPPEIAHLNGFSLADCGAEFERLAARILEGFGLLREKRRLFISYRRAETSGVAAQLYEALDLAGFDVFLDTHGVIRPGEPFQELLWHRLADTDVALLLDSPEFLASRWGEEEIARANNSTIQVLQILWPGQTEGATAAFSTFHPLTEEDFSGKETLGPAAQMTDKCVSEIVDEVEGLRARAIAARHAFLVREFVMEARKEGLKVLKTLELTLILSAPSGNRVLVMPAIGVPDAERYQTLERLHQRDVGMGETYAQPPVLLYDQTGIRSRWLQHLGWLNEHIAAARSISIMEARAWLSDLKANDGR